MSAMHSLMTHSPIGVFDSGFGGLTILKNLVASLPQHDFLYLGDNARAPYGPRSFETVYAYTLECVTWLFEQGCPLVVLACNTASAKALRSIQQNDLPQISPYHRVLGVIRPTTEAIDHYTRSKHVGIIGTRGTIQSHSYVVEITKFFPNISVFQHACPMWVPLVENAEGDSPAADYFIQKDLELLFKKSSQIDTLVLACTHYPLLLPRLMKFVPKGVTVLSQGEIVSKQLAAYLVRHNDMDKRISKNKTITFCTTDSSQEFDRLSSQFLETPVFSRTVHIS